MALRRWWGTSLLLFLLGFGLGQLTRTAGAEHMVPNATLSVQAINQEDAEMYLSNPYVSFGSVSPRDGDYYHELPQATRLFVRANTAWKLYARADADLASAANPAHTIPASQLEIRAMPGSRQEARFTPFRKGERLLVASGGPTGGRPEEIDVDLRLLITWDDPPGTYQTQVFYELTTEG